MRPVRKRACAANQKSALGAGEQPLALPGALPSERLDQKKREVLVRVGGAVLSGRVLKRLRAAAQRKELPGRSARLRGNGAFAGLQGLWVENRAPACGLKTRVGVAQKQRRVTPDSYRRESLRHPGVRGCGLVEQRPQPAASSKRAEHALLASAYAQRQNRI